MIKHILITLAIGLSIGFGSGWQVNDWKNSKQLLICEQNNTLLRKAIDVQNNKVTELETKTNQSKEAQKAALIEAQKVIASLRSRVDVVRSANAQSCEEAETLINRFITQ